MRSARMVAILALAGIASGTHGQTVFPEVEPNETKATASGPFTLAPGDAITGTTTGTSTTNPGSSESADTFLVRTAPQALGVYKHRLILTTPGFSAHTISMRGLTQSAGIINPASDVQSYQGQTSSNPPRYLQWYGFGKEEGIYLRVTGTANTTSPYFGTLETTPQVIRDLGIFREGEITITTTGMGYTGDTALWVYDSEFNPVVINGQGFGNDQAPETTNSLSTLTRTFPPGVYHLGVTIAEMVLDQPAPSDDRRRNMTAADFPDVVWSEATTGTANMSFRVIDADGEVPVTNVFKTDRHEINWFRFEVGEPPLGACCLEDGVCTMLTENLCRVQLGNYAGDGTDCSHVTCLEPGACCTLGECHIISVRACILMGDLSLSWPQCGTCRPSDAVMASLPPQSSTFTGTGTNLLSRGFWFTAPTDFVIRGLRVPDPLQHGTQHVEVVRFEEPPPSGNLAGTNAFTSLLRREFLPSEAIIECAIAVEAGDIIGIVGICGDETVTHVSYGQGPFNSSILGEATTFHRLLMQHNLATSAARSLSTSSAEIGRIEMYYAAPGSPCYANCDGSTTPPILNVDDFTCFINEFAQGLTLSQSMQVLHYANCDGNGVAPVLNVDDFTCFINAYAQGCR